MHAARDSQQSSIEEGRFCLSKPEHGPVGAGSEEATKILRGLEILCYGDKQRAGSVEPGEGSRKTS